MMKLHNEMRTAMAYVIEAEENAAAWKQEAAERMKKVHKLIRAEEIASDTKIDKKEVIAALRAEIMPEAPAENEQPVGKMETYSEPDIPDNVEANCHA